MCSPDWGRTDVTQIQAGKHLNDVTNHSLEIPPGKVKVNLENGYSKKNSMSLGASVILRFLKT